MLLKWWILLGAILRPSRFAPGCSKMVWKKELLIQPPLKLKWILQGTILRPPDYESGALTS